MRSAGFSILLCACLLLLFSDIKVQAQLLQDPDTVYFTSNRKKITMPFKLVHNLIVLPVKINNSQELNFILDTGVRNTLITQLYFSDSLELKDSNRIKIRGLGEGYTIEALHSTGNTMFMPGIQGDNHTVYVLLEEVFDLSKRMGMPVHGIIGYDIFKNFIVKINYSSETITLYRPDQKIKKKRRAEEYPLYIEDAKPYLYATVRQHNGDSLNVKLIVDTGASHCLSLYLPTDDRLALPPKVMQAYLGRGLGGDINGKIGRLQGFKLGKYELENLTASYPDEEAVKLALNIAGRNGNLGSAILKRFTVIFDYPHQRISLIPNRKFKEPFNYNMAGFEITTPLPGANFYVVSNVIDDSPAKMVGMQPGDQLLHINGRNTNDLKLQELLNMLDSKPGSKLRLRLKREQEIIDVNFVLQSRI
ncbi:aspartyl protease family protein [Pontibacter anaerobius]|uniref:Aspartyl protease family protein n=1 Tax=Pontibacter anaerobius TaxID=2993940 RepID=A0ABT3RKG1_9BACT|nr:aspartyl protease family protein [Pontibacter anaerobius]MCX2741868.1 aspartyl protease family protein [Pontibacter anaerobius]